MRTPDDLQKPHVARRIEEVGDQEVAREALGQTLGQPRERQRRGVGRHDRAALAHAFEPGIERLLDRQVLDHGFDDPVHLAERVQIVLQVARGDQTRGLAAHERRGIGFLHPLERALGERVAIVRPFRHHVEQQDRDTGVGDLRRDAGAHHPGAEHRRPLDRHQIASSTVAMPWPPPMHWVASA